MDEDAKATAIALLSKRKAQGAAPTAPAPAPREEHDGRLAAAEEILRAQHEQNPAMFVKALANFIDIHSIGPKTPANTDPTDEA